MFGHFNRFRNRSLNFGHVLEMFDHDRPKVSDLNISKTGRKDVTEVVELTIQNSNKNTHSKAYNKEKSPDDD